MFKIINNLIPHTASFNFKASSTIHKHFTRYRENLYISYCRTSCRVSTVNIQGPKLWNYILNNHHELATLKSGRLLHFRSRRVEESSNIHVSVFVVDRDIDASTDVMMIVDALAIFVSFDVVVDIRE